jgi:sirohydrochlorin cobaltochelatase
MPNDLIVLAMHGAPPRDFPAREMAEFMGLHARLEHADAGAVPPPVRARAADLERRVREWPRTPSNDPFWAASHELGRHLAEATGRCVLVGFNEFCAPDLDATLDLAVAGQTARVIVVTPMLTRGGGHAEADIPAAIARARDRHPHVAFVYAWPYDMAVVARFLAERVTTAESGGPEGLLHR